MNPLHQQVSDALNHQRTELAAQMVAREFVRHPELEKRFGQAGRKKCLQDAGYHLAYLAQAIAADQPALFRNYIAWAKVMLAKRGVPATDLGGLLETMQGSLREALPLELSELACTYLDAALQALPQMPDEVPSFITDDAPFAPLARAYLQALLKGERHTATTLILDAVKHGASVHDLYLHVFQSTQYEVGRLWQINQISVAQEHACTAATQLIMSQLYPYIFGTEKTHGTFVATCVSGDMHEIGARMLSDFFELEGWSTHYLGANVPTQSIVQTLVEHRASVLAISATITYHVPAVEELIAAVRRHPECAGVKILVGGYPFKVAPDLWEKVGADGSANSAGEALSLAHRLTSQPLAA